MVQHVDPEILALVALGERDVASDDELTHLETCPQCRSEVASLDEVATTARTEQMELVAPPPQVWDRVRAELGMTTQDDQPAPPAAPPAAASASAEVVDIGSRRRRAPALWASAAAAVALVVGIGGGVAWERSRMPAPTPEILPLAEAQLEPLPQWPTSTGQAVLEEGPTGEMAVVVTVEVAEPEEGYRMVWLLANDLSGMVSLGVLEGDSGVFAVPTGLDLDLYSLVDVSQEPLDGDPTHSGDSIVRGALTET